MKNYTTGIAVEKTVMEIEQLLVKFGAEGIYKDYKGTRIAGLMFFLRKNGQKIPFKIPMKTDKMRNVVMKLVQEGKLPRKFNEEPLRTEQGERIGWRVCKDWIHSQLSLMEMEFADSVELFLPYAYNMAEDKTMYQKFLENKEKYLALEIEKDESNI